METKSLFEFLDSSKTAYHTVENICARLTECGYERLYENDSWELSLGGKYFVVRDGSSVIAFRNNGGGFNVAASHSDSPAFRVKGVKGGVPYARFDVEKYGGGILYSWLDRPLSVAGRAVVKCGDELSVKVVTLPNRTTIPSLAIHLNRTVNDGVKLNPAQDMLPLVSLGEFDLTDAVAKTLGTDKESVVSHELMLVSAEAPVTVGASNELIVAPRLDDLACVFTSLEAFLSAKDTASTPVLAVFDNEEVGSDTKQGASSTFLHNTLKRISGSEAEYFTRLATSFMVSADNAHARHPNHPELSDAENAPILGGGVVIKCNANQRYTTDAVSEAVFSNICASAGVKTMKYYNRADQLGGSTLGSIADTKVSVHTVDIGIPQLAMHSLSEICAVSDVCAMAEAITAFFSSVMEIRGERIVIK